jgi:hypothetical protein
VRAAKTATLTPPANRKSFNDSDASAVMISAADLAG